MKLLHHLKPEIITFGRTLTKLIVLSFEWSMICTCQGLIVVNQLFCLLTHCYLAFSFYIITQPLELEDLLHLILGTRSI